MKYEIKIRVQSCEMDYEKNSASVLAELVLERDGEEVSCAKDAVVYSCQPLDGGEISKEGLLFDIAQGKLEEKYSVDFDMLDDDSLLSQLRDNAEEEVPMESIDAAFDAFCEESDEYKEFAELFPQGPFAR